MVSYVKPPSYEGREPYIFISYAHKDDAMVLPAIVALQRAGYRVWYDAGIQVGTEWPENIARHLLRSTLAIAFISQNAVASDHCRQEITYAISKKVPMLTVRLDDAPMPPGVEMQLNLRQTLNAYLHPNLESFIGELVGASYIKEVFAAAATRAPQPPRNGESIAAPSNRTPTKPLSAEDLKLRGPGDFFGNRQHGLPQLHIADLAGDMRILRQAQDAAARLLEEDPTLSRSEHRAVLGRVRSLFEDNPDIFN